MRIDKIEVKPAIESINPELIFDIHTFIEKKQEIPLEITGHILSEDNKKLANIYQIFQAENQLIELSAIENRGNEETIISYKLTAPLNHKILDYIETLRSMNPKGDIVLKVEIFAKILQSQIILSHLVLAEKDNEGYQTVFYKHQQNHYPYQNDMWLLSGDNSSTFIKVLNKKFQNQVIIPSSDWIHDYCPVFQIGKFTVFEYLLPEYTEGKGSIEERLNKSISAIKKMEDNMLEGEWNEVVEDSRAIWELLRNHDEIKDLLIDDGYTDQAFENLNESIKQLFNFSSKFIHQEEIGNRKIMPEMKASKEDAYLIYALSMNLVNLISKKSQKLH